MTRTSTTPTTRPLLIHCATATFFEQLLRKCVNAENQTCFIYISSKCQSKQSEDLIWNRNLVEKTVSLPFSRIHKILATQDGWFSVLGQWFSDEQPRWFVSNHKHEMRSKAKASSSLSSAKRSSVTKITQGCQISPQSILIENCSNQCKL